MKALSLATLLVTVVAFPVAADVVAPASEALTLTLSQGSNALVYDQRTLDLPQGNHMLRWDGVSPLVIGGSLMLQAADMVVQEQVLQPATLSAQAVQEAWVGRDVTVFWNDDSTQVGETLKLLAVNPILFQRGEQWITGTPARIIYEGQTLDFSPLPALQVKLDATKAGSRQFSLSYLTEGLQWQANYTARYDGWQQLELSSWANLSNHTGLTFPLAKVRLLAGEQAEVYAKPLPRMAALSAMADNEAMHRETVGGLYHLYTLPESLALKDNEDRQVPLIPVSNLTVKRQLVLEGNMAPYGNSGDNAPAMNPDLQLVLTNDLGQPLPAGVIRIFQKDERETPVFMGADSLPNLPVGEKTTLNIGKAFDITARRSLLNQTIQPATSNKEKVTKSSWSITIKNAGTRPAEVQVREHLYGEWTISDESLPHKREAGNVAVWTVPVPARGETVLTWKAQVR